MGHQERYNDDPYRLPAVSGEGDGQCGEATMAAMEVISEQCGRAGTPVELPTGMIVMVPDELMDQIAHTDIEDISDQEIRMLDEEVPWLSNAAHQACDMMGLDRHDDEYPERLMDYMRNLLRAVADEAEKMGDGSYR